MLDIAKSPKANVMPCLTYRDAPAAVEFLCRAFGFAKKMVVPGADNTIAHAELTLGNAMVMLGSTKDTDYGRLVKPPRVAPVRHARRRGECRRRRAHYWQRLEQWRWWWV